MSNNTVGKIENLYKEYRLGVIGHGTLYRDLQSWWANVRGKEDPNSLIGYSSNGTITDHILALNDINLEVKEGEVLGIIGKNGAGKSTLLKILSRVTAPSSGIVKVKGRIASLLEVGTGFHPELTGRENIFLNGSILGMRKTEIVQKFDEIVNFAEIEKFIDTPVKRYSGGMLVRLAFAVAAHLEPEILLVDEVLAVGDYSFQKKCIGKMENVAGQGRTILFVSHQMQAIEKLCPRSILLDNGKKVLEGPSREVVKHYLESSFNGIKATPLEKRSKRAGSGYYRFIKVWFSDNLGNIVSGVRTGEPANIHALVVPCIEKKPISTYASLCLRDRIGYRLFTLASAGKNIKLELSGPTEICWKIKQIPMLEGDYICDLYLAGEMFGKEVVDYVLDAFILPVLPTDYLGSGRSQVKGLDKIHVDFDINSKKVK